MSRDIVCCPSYGGDKLTQLLGVFECFSKVVVTGRIRLDFRHAPSFPPGRRAIACWRTELPTDDCPVAWPPVGGLPGVLHPLYEHSGLSKPVPGRFREGYTGRSLAFIGENDGDGRAVLSHLHPLPNQAASLPPNGWPTEV